MAMAKTNTLHPKVQDAASKTISRSKSHYNIPQGFDLVAIFFSLSLILALYPRIRVKHLWFS